MDEAIVETLAKEVADGKLRLHEIEEKVGNDANVAAKIRLRALEILRGTPFPTIASHTFDFNRLLTLNIENPIGGIQIPVGVAGPIRVAGEYADGNYYIPLATSEGALVASVNRGCSAITSSGEARSRVIKDGITRAPLFRTSSVREAQKLVAWIQENFPKLVEMISKADAHCHLQRVDPYIVGNNTFLRFSFSTDDAMGMNMATIACDEVRRLIEKELPFAKCVSLSGNLCVDKKPSAMNLIQGRGKTVVSEAIIKEDIVKEVLKTTPKGIVEVNWRKNYVGSALAGSYGFNAHFANIVAAMFLATGQDAAQVVESSLGITTAEVLDNGNLYISVTLPSLEVGTVGGGTRLPTQQEALKILDCQGGGTPPGSNAKKFAEIIAAAVLAGELSLLSALSMQQLAEAHIKLGRAGVRSGLKVG